MKIVKHPTGEYIIFDEYKHSYKLKAKQKFCQSGTRFIGQFFPVFDKEAVAERVAEKRGVNKEDLLKEWAESGKVACDLGNTVHGYIEKIVKKQKAILPKDKKAKTYCKHAKEFLTHITKTLGYETIDAEMIIADTDHLIAGTIDLLLKKDDTLLFVDWKTNKEITVSNHWQKALEPLEELDDCNYNKYALQLNLYRYIVKKHKYFKGIKNFKMSIVHIKEDGHFEYVIDNMESTIRKMINYKKVK